MLIVVVGIALLTTVAAATSAGASKTTVPVLGHAFYESKGYGHAHPKELSSGGNAITFAVWDIRWKRWGAKRAVGTGTGWYVPRSAKAISDGREATKKVVAFDLGECDGRRAYRQLSWFFPDHGGHFDASEANKLCSGSRSADGNEKSTECVACLVLPAGNPYALEGALASEANSRGIPGI